MNYLKKTIFCFVLLLFNYPAILLAKEIYRSDVTFNGSKIVINKKQLKVNLRSNYRYNSLALSSLAFLFFITSSNNFAP